MTKTGGAQQWATSVCPLTADAKGTHDLCLVYTGADAGTCSLQWFAFHP